MERSLISLINAPGDIKQVVETLKSNLLPLEGRDIIQDVYIKYAIASKEIEQFYPQFYQAHQELIEEHTILKTNYDTCVSLLEKHNVELGGATGDSILS